MGGRRTGEESRNLYHLLKAKEFSKFLGEFYTEIITSYVTPVKQQEHFTRQPAKSFHRLIKTGLLFSSLLLIYNDN